MSNVNSWYTYLQCSVILNNHNNFVVDLLIMKNELDDDSYVMIRKKNTENFCLLCQFSKQLLEMFHAVLLIICDLFWSI